MISGPEQGKKKDQQRQAEPLRLIQRGRDREMKRRGAITPDAITVAGDYGKRIVAGRQIRVKSLTARTGIVPIMFIAVESVAELHLLWNQKRRRGVINLQVARVRRELHVAGCRELLSVNDDRLDVGLCR